jgi:hypothetical protein
MTRGIPAVGVLFHDGRRCSLSPGERVGVRGKKTSEDRLLRILPVAFSIVSDGDAD